MDSHSLTLLLVLIVLVGLSAFFSATETAYMSLSRIKIKNLANGGDKRARRVLKLCENYDNLLSTVLIGNNIVNIAASSIATVLFIKYLGGNGATVSTIVMTVTVLIFGEISPKGIAKEMPERYALAVSGVLQVLSVVFKPFNFLLVKFKGLLGRLFRVKEDSGITEDEILTIVDEAEQDGGLDSNESELIRNVIAFTDCTAQDILTPRIDVTAVEKGTSVKEMRATFRESGFSRIPLYDETVDDIVGILNEKDFYAHTENGETSLVAMMQPALFVPASVKVPDLLAQMQQKKTHMVIVVDEFGGTEGVVTLEDVLEELVGEIWDEHDEEEQEDITALTPDTFTVDALTPLEDFFEEFDVYEQTDVATVNGWVQSHTGKMPQVDDTFDFGHLTITVESIDEQRADLIRVTVHPKSESEEET